MFFPSRAEAFVMACELYAAGHERTLADIARGFAERAAAKQGDGWKK